MKMIDKVQIQIIHIAKHQLGLADETYRDIMATLFGKDSCKDLSHDQANKLIDHFKTLGFALKGRQKCGWCAPRIDRGKVAPNVTFMVSQGQLDMIEALRSQIRWQYADGYERWLKKYAKTDVVRTSLQASRVIEGLKGILRSQADCKGCSAIKILPEF